MNISSVSYGRMNNVNSFSQSKANKSLKNMPSFSASYTVTIKEESEAEKARKKAIKSLRKTGSAISLLVMYLLGVATNQTANASTSENYDTNKGEKSAYVEQYDYQSQERSVNVPADQRTPEYYKIKSGDTLYGIVKHFAQLPKGTPDEVYESYYEILEADNPGAWKNRDSIKPGQKIRVDGISPDSVLSIQYDNSSYYDEVIVNDMPFKFDQGTASKGLFGSYSGLTNGKYTTICGNFGGGVTVKQYSSEDPYSDLRTTIVYDENQEIIEYSNCA